MATYQVRSMEQALKALDEGEPDDEGMVYLEAFWELDVADALDLAAWYVSNVGVETLEKEAIQDWLAVELVEFFDLDTADADHLGEQAAAAVAVKLGLSDELGGHAYEDEGMVSDEYIDLLHEAIEHTNGDPGRLFREIATELRGKG